MRVRFMFPAIVVATFAAAQEPTAAQDACVIELRRLNQFETANQNNKNAATICIYMQNQIKLESDYAILYRKCGEGMDAEIEAHQHDIKAANFRSLLARNCVGGRTKNLSDYLR
jgi:hypothetical protein